MWNKGKRQYRFKDNPAERIFAEEWEKANTSYATGELDGKGYLDYLLAEEPNYPMGEVTPRDRCVAATVIQWLGSTVGQYFLRDTLEKINV